MAVAVNGNGSISQAGVWTVRFRGYGTTWPVLRYELVEVAEQQPYGSKRRKYLIALAGARAEYEDANGVLQEFLTLEDARASVAH
jgi:hypothetical protein